MILVVLDATFRNDYNLIKRLDAVFGAGVTAGKLVEKNDRLDRKKEKSNRVAGTITQEVRNDLSS